jgi:FtsP/CotA-like multicopper oxidase with cupredoxin domain
VANALQPPHPIHKHSNKFFVIGQGEGKWKYSSIAEAMHYIPQSFNFETPQIRDTFATPPAATGPTWLAIRYHVVNPGAFLLHCHIQIHQSGGMALALLDGIDEWPEIPDEYQLAKSGLQI